jgi:hypothetical protein
LSIAGGKQPGRVQQPISCVGNAWLVQVVGADVVERVLNAHRIAAFNLDFQLH